MRVQFTKFGHSCVMVETADRVGFFNPGKWSDYDLDKIERIDRVAITHEHGDHFDVEKVQAIAQKFPHIKIVVNKAIEKQLVEAGVKAEIASQTMCTVPFTASHASLESFGFELPQHNGIHFKQIYTDPGDTHYFNETMPVLGLPIVGPWGHAVDAVATLLKLKPQHVFLTHDWHLTREGFDWYQDVVEQVCSKNDINFIRVENGTPFTIDI